MSKEAALDELQHIKEWFTTLPPEPVVRWTSVCIVAGRATGWVDVEVAGLQESLNVGWVWTVVEPAGADDWSMCIALAPDANGWWSATTISRALEAWVKKESGRDDIAFLFDARLPSVMAWQLSEAIADAPETETYQLAERVTATAGVMDALLAMPWEGAAAVTQVLATIQALPPREASGED